MPQALIPAATPRAQPPPWTMGRQRCCAFSRRARHTAHSPTFGRTQDCSERQSSTLEQSRLRRRIDRTYARNDTSIMVTGTGTLQQGAAGETGEPQPRRTANDNRRSNKPIMEKRRRARINNCLNELKTLILDAMKKDPARHSKLEKADILEMTVRHLENLQRQQSAMSAAADPAVVNKFRAGFSECAGEVGRFPGVDPTIKRRLLQHLAGCLAGANLNKQDAPQSTPVQVHILPSPSHNPSEAPSGIIFSSNGSGSGVQLVPTRLPNGDIALVLPASSSQQNLSTGASPLPLLVPIPTRTASTGSAASSVSSSSYSNPVSPQSINRYSPPLQKPLSLVVRKNIPMEDVDEQPWRPW